MWVDVLCTVLFTVVMFVGGGGLGTVRSVCSVFTLCTLFVDCEGFLFIVCTGGCLAALFTTGWSILGDWVGFVNWGVGWGFGALEGGCGE